MLMFLMKMLFWMMLLLALLLLLMIFVAAIDDKIISYISVFNFPPSFLFFVTFVNQLRNKRL